jgi:predicted ester cyclase
MSTQENKTLVRRIFEEGINQNRPSVFDDLIAPSYVNYDLPAPSPGPEGFKMIMGLFRAAFPDMHVTLEEELAEGDRVMTRGYFTATHEGDFQGIPATGKQIKVKYMDVWRVADGKLVENWVRLDQLGMMQQLGVVPVPGA